MQNTLTSQSGHACEVNVCIAHQSLDPWLDYLREKFIDLYRDQGVPSAPITRTRCLLCVCEGRQLETLAPNAHPEKLGRLLNAGSTSRVRRCQAELGMGWISGMASILWTSNSVWEWRYRLIHLTILRRFFSPSLACIGTTVARPHAFSYRIIHNRLVSIILNWRSLWTPILNWRLFWIPYLN